MGTPHYMSPEQANGLERDITTSADIYSLGAILYEMVSGQRPHRADSLPELLRKVTEEEPVPPFRIDRSIDKDLNTIILKCLGKRAETRYASAAGLAAELNRWLEGQTILARPASPLERSIKWMKRRPVHAAVTVSGILFLLLLGIGGPTVALQQAALRSEAEAARSLAQDRENSLRSTLYFSELLLASTFIGERNDTTRIRETVSRWHPENAGIELRGWEWYYLDNLKLERLSERKFGARVRSFSSHPGNSLIAVATTDSLVLEDWAESKPRIGIGPDTHLVRWFPQGDRMVASSFRKGSRVLDIKGNKIVERFESSHDGVCEIQVSPDNSLVAIGYYKGQIAVLDAGTGKRLARMENAGQYGFLCWSSDSLQLYFRQVTTIGVWNREDGSTEVVGNVRLNPILSSLALSPDGKTLAVGSHSGTLLLIDTTTGLAHSADEMHAEAVVHLTWSPSGGHIASAGLDGKIKIWDRQSRKKVKEFRNGSRLAGIEWNTPERLRVASGESLFELETALGKEYDSFLLSPKKAVHRNTLSFTRNDSLMAAAGGTLYEKGQHADAFQPLFEAGFHIRRAAVSPCGRYAATSGGKGPLVLTDVDSGTDRMRIDEVPWIDEMCFSPDSRLLVTAHHGDSSIRLWDVLKGTIKFSWDSKGALLSTGVTWSPDGELLATIDAYGTIRLWDPDEGRVLTEQKHAIPGSGKGIKWSPKGDQIASGCGGKGVFVQSIAEGILSEASLVLEDPGIGDFDWCPDGCRIASINTGGSIHIFDPNTGSIALRLKVGLNPPYDKQNMDLEWSHDGRTIAYSIDVDGRIHTLQAPDWVPESDHGER